MKLWHITVGPLATNCYIAADQGGDCVVIDPGDNAARILALLNEHALRAKYIFLTHGHFDHIQAVAPLKEATDALVVIHELEAYGQADVHAEEGTLFSVGELSFSWLHTPGHTPGSCVILCKNALFTGDTLFKEDCGRCDLPGGDTEAMLSSLCRLAQLEGDYDVYPGHDAFSALSYERAFNPSMLEALSGRPGR